VTSALGARPVIPAPERRLPPSLDPAGPARRLAPAILPATVVIALAGRCGRTEPGAKWRLDGAGGPAPGGGAGGAQVGAVADAAGRSATVACGR